jgi:hypothetical protein
MPRKPTSKKSKKYFDEHDIELALLSDEDDDELDKIIISEDEEDEEDEEEEVDVPPREILEVIDKNGKIITYEGEELEKFVLEAAPFTIGEITDEFLPITPHPDRDCHSPQLSETDAPPDSGPLGDPISPQPLYEVRPSTPPPPDRQEDTNSPPPSDSDRIISHRPQPPLEYPLTTHPSPLDQHTTIHPPSDRDCHSPQLSETDAPPDSGPLGDPISPQPLYEVRPSTPPPPDRQEDTNSPPPSDSGRIISFRPQPPLEYTTTTPSSDRDCDSPQLSETDAPPDSDPIEFRPSTPPSPDWDEDTISPPPPASDRLSLRAVLWIQNDFFPLQTVWDPIPDPDPVGFDINLSFKKRFFKNFLFKYI